MLEWTQDTDGNWCSRAKTFCVVHREDRGWTLNYDDWDGPELGPDFETADEAEALAQRLQDVLDGRNAVSEAVERVVEALEKMRPKTRECAASSPVFTGYDDAMADAILILRSRDWSRGGQ